MLLALPVRGVEVEGGPVLLVGKGWPLGTPALGLRLGAFYI